MLSGSSRENNLPQDVCLGYIIYKGYHTTLLRSIVCPNFRIPWNPYYQPNFVYHVMWFVQLCILYIYILYILGFLVVFSRNLSAKKSLELPVNPQTNEATLGEKNQCMPGMATGSLGLPPRTPKIGRKQPFSRFQSPFKRR